LGDFGLHFGRFFSKNSSDHHERKHDTRPLVCLCWRSIEIIYVYVTITLSRTPYTHRSLRPLCMHAGRSNWPKIVGLAPADMARLPPFILTKIYF
jgi:hypothetical protein